MLNIPKRCIWRLIVFDVYKVVKDKKNIKNGGKAKQNVFSSENVYRVVDLYLFDIVDECGNAANLKAEFFQRLQPLAQLLSQRED